MLLPSNKNLIQHDADPANPSPQLLQRIKHQEEPDLL